MAFAGFKKGAPHPILVELFDRMDSNRDGAISKKEFKAAFTGKYKAKYEHLLGAIGLGWRDVFARLDVDCNESLDFAEFVAGCSQTQKMTGESLDEGVRTMVHKHHKTCEHESTEVPCASPGSAPSSCSRSPVGSPGTSSVLSRLFGDRSQLVGSDGAVGEAARLELNRDGSYRWYVQILCDNAD